MLERWRERDVFARSLAQREGAPTWSFYEGPPTANGRPGSHHVLSRVFKDIYPRYRTMCGYRVPRKAGWDCHGLPVELEVERELGISSKAEIEAYGIAEFNQRCRESVFRYVEDWNRLTERIGFWIDLDDPYVTLENDYIESVWWALRRIWDDERLYEGHKVVPYCPRCGTALSSHEVALGYHDVEDPVGLREAADPASRRPATRSPRAPLRAGRPAARLDDDPLDADLERRGRRRRRRSSTSARRLGDEVFVLARDAGREGARRGRRGARPLPRRGARRHRLRAALRLHHRLRPARPHGAARRLRHHRRGHRPRPHRDRLRRGRLPARRAVRDHAPEPGRPSTARFDERVTDFAGPLGQGRRPRHRRGAGARGAGCCAPRPTCTPIRTAGAATRRCSTTRSRAGTCAPPRSATGCSPTTSEIGWHPEHIKHGRFGKWLENNVDWALSRDRYWGTPLPIWECDGRGLRGALLRRLDRRPARARAARSPTTSTAPTSTRSYLPCEREGCDGEMRRVAVGDRRLVRLGLDAVRPVPLPVRERGAVRGALPRRLHLRGDRPDPRLVLHAARRVGAALRRPPATATASASG